MRFESVTAHAFGPFSQLTLCLASGMTVVYGPNEAGKSTWHAALFAGLCGMRRRKGSMQQEEREFAERHKPWDSDLWKVSSIVVLADGRRIELIHDLITRVDCRATDMVLGRDCSSEIMHEGSPDGSKWLGLDRRSFLATACVPQADLLAILEDPSILQQHLQRAASTSGTDSTAAAALECIRRFQSQQVGQDRSNSARPLRMAINQVDSASREVERATNEHKEYLAIAADSEARDQTAKTLQQQLALVRAKRAQIDARAWDDRLQRARSLDAHFPDGAPSDLMADDTLAQDVATALRAWNERPEVQAFEGETASELEVQLKALPNPPAGDVSPHPNVLAARDLFRDATRALERHIAERPDEPAPSESGEASEQELRDLARELALSQPPLDPALQVRLDQAQKRVEALSKRQSGRTLLVTGGALATVGALVFLLGMLGVGLALFIAGGALVVWALARGTNDARVKALEELRVVENALGDQQHAARDVASRRDAARARATSLRLVADSAVLLEHADEGAAAGRAKQEFERWKTREHQLTVESGQARSHLVVELSARGVTAGKNAPEALEAYEQDCGSRAAVAAEAARRPDLQRRIADRHTAEAVAADARRRRQQVEEELRALANRCGVLGGSDPELATGLQDWQQARLRDLGQQAAGRNEWAALESLLNGGTLAELDQEANRRRDASVRLVGLLEQQALDGLLLEDDVDAQQERLEVAARDAEAALNQTLGQLATRARQLHSVAETEEALSAAKDELARIRQLDATLTQTTRFLKDAQDRIHRTIAPKLAASVYDWLPKITADRYQEVLVDPETLDVSVRGKDRPWRKAALLSHGTAEQIYMLLRVAMAEHLTKAGEVCPLVLDDVTVQCDSQRKVAVLSMLQRISERRQVILFSQESAVLAWAAEHLREPEHRIEQLDTSLVVA
jgi:uncharacterized protein YhaN